MNEQVNRLNHPSPLIEDDFIPAELYTAPDVTAAEKARLWPRVWQMACREEDIPRVGDFVSYEIFEESVLVIRSAADEVRAFYNVCQHRGRRLRDEPCGHLSQFYCRFHGWKYNLDGTIANVYQRQDWEGRPGFTDEALSLKQVRVGRWGGWVWINMDPDAPELMDYLGDVPEHLDPFEFEKLRRVWDVTIKAEVNWKVVVEAFAEGYHSLATHTDGMRFVSHQPSVAHGLHGMYYAVHGGEGGPEYYRNDAGEWVQPKTLQESLLAHTRHIYKTLKAMTLDPHLAAVERWAVETSPDEDAPTLMAKLWRTHQQEFEKRDLDWPENLTPEAFQKAGLSWLIFPHSMVLPTPDGALWYRFRPDGDDPGRCVFDIWCLGRVLRGQDAPVVENQVFEGLEAARGANSFLSEDFDNMRAVQKGMTSRGWSGARVSPVEEVVITNFHRQLQAYTT